MTFPFDATDGAILEIAFAWLDLLVEERYQEAFDATWHSTEDTWTPELMRRMISNYGSLHPHWTGHVFRPSRPAEERSVRQPSRDVTRYSSDRLLTDIVPRVVGEVWFDLPLNGEWSDLTATFDLTEWDGGLVLALSDIRVH